MYVCIYIYIHTQIHIHTYACLACCLLIELFIMRIYTYTDTHLYIGYFSRLRIYYTELYCNILSYSVLLHMTLGYMTLYIYIYVIIYIYILIYVCIYVHVHMYTYVYTHKHTRIRTYIHTYENAYIRKYMVLRRGTSHTALQLKSTL